MLPRPRILTGLLVFLLPCASVFAQDADPFGGDDPFGDPPPAAKEAPAKASDDPFGGADPFGDTAPAFKPAKQKKTPEMDASLDPIGGSKPIDNIAAKQKVAQADTGTESGDADMRIQAALDDETTLTFIETPLEEAVAMISRMHNIPIVVDRRALEELGLHPDTPVNLSLKNVTLRSFLRLMLREIDCTYMIKDEVMQITTVQVAEQNLIIRSYTMDEELAPRTEKIVKALTASVVPVAWATAGGPCNVSPVDHVLVVSATSDIHDQVSEFMKMLAEAFEKKKVNR